MDTETKILAEGQLPNTKTTAYTVPAGKACIVSSMTFVNTDAGALAINVYIKKSGSTSRRIIEKDFSLAAAAAAGSLKNVTVAYALSAGDIIEWDAGTAAKVDGTITGTELSSQ